MNDESSLNDHKSLSMSPSVKELTGALIAVQRELPTLPKDKENPFFKSKYAGLETVLPAALKVLTDHKLGLVQSVGQDSKGGTTLTTILLHESGEWISDTQPLLLTKSDPQSQGSAITYGRRYALMAMLGLVADDDDDGHAASRRQPARRTPQPRAANPATTPHKPPQSTPAPAQSQAVDESAQITQQQIRGIHGSLKQMFGDDERAAYDWLKEVQPRTCAASETTYHLGELTMAEASAILAAANEVHAPRRPASPPLATSSTER